MTAHAQKSALRYSEPAPRADRRPWVLVTARGGAEEERFAFYDEIKIGRGDGQPEAPGVVLVPDPTVSRCHCVVARHADGRCFIRDVSRNGTRLDGRRLVPNIEMEVRPGQTIAVAEDVEFVFQGDTASWAQPDDEFGGCTVGKPGTAIVTLLVGDIRDYTVLVRRAPSAGLQQSVTRVFEVLSRMVGDLEGTVKEYQGDALVAFWEGDFSGAHAAKACHAALELDRVVQRLAGDRSVWQVVDFPLRMDWALATGPVVIDSFGGSQRVGLSMIGEPIVLAFRLEKFANDELGHVLACRLTRDMASQSFRFRDLGRMIAKGFDQPDHVFALDGEPKANPEGAG
jgi:class 3 adenylate cyclase